MWVGSVLSIPRGQTNQTTIMKSIGGFRIRTRNILVTKEYQHINAVKNNVFQKMGTTNCAGMGIVAIVTNSLAAQLRQASG